MSHPDEEDLVTFVLGEPTDARIGTHVADCASCAAEAERLRDVVTATRRVGREQIVLERPPEHVWSAILEETREPAAATPAAPAAPVTGRRRRRVLVGAVAGFAVGVAATVAATLLLDRDAAPRPVTDTSRTIAEGVVRPLPADGTTTGRTTGSVTVVEDHDRRSMRIRLNRTATTGTNFVQAWLLDPRNNHMIALGLMENRTETFPLPDGVDLAAYSSVDISLEPFDGDPQHSATSLARGPVTLK